MTFTAPHIDYAGLSPVIALSAGIVIVLTYLAVMVRANAQAFPPAPPMWMQPTYPGMR